MEIEKGIPIPVSALQKRGRKHEYSALEVGDSIFIPNGIRRGLRGSTTRYGKLAKKRFVVDHAEKDGFKGVRIWRSA